MALILSISQIGIVHGQLTGKSFRPCLSTIAEHSINGLKYSASDRGNKIILLTASTLVLASLKYDRATLDYIQKQNPLPPFLAQFGDYYGNYRAGFGLVTGIGLEAIAGLHSADMLFKRLEYASLAMLATAQVTLLLKLVVGRERPSGKNFRSFPSGHTSHSFAVATIVNTLYGPIPGIVTYTCASLVALSRIQDDAHYLSDVIFGAALGIVIARGFARAYDWDKDESGKNFHFQLWANNSQIGLTYKF